MVDSISEVRFKVTINALNQSEVVECRHWLHIHVYIQIYSIILVQKDKTSLDIVRGRYMYVQKKMYIAFKLGS